MTPAAERLLTEDLLKSHEERLRGRGAKGLRSVSCRVELLKEALGHFRALDLTTEDVEKFRAERIAAGRNRATVDRDVEVLRAAFRWALKCKRVPAIPFFPMDGADNVKTGFFEAVQADAIDAALVAAGEHVAAEILRFERFTGWRISEALGLRWEWIDRAAGEIWLPDSKNGEVRTVPLYGELAALIERRWQAREFQTRRGSALSAFVFHGRGGRPVAYGPARRPRCA